MDKDEIHATWAKQAFAEEDWASCMKNIEHSGRFRIELAEIEAIVCYRRAQELSARGLAGQAESFLRRALALGQHLEARDRYLLEERLALCRRGLPRVTSNMCPVCRQDPAVQVALLLKEDAFQPEVDSIYCTAAYRSGYDPARANVFSEAIRKGKTSYQLCRSLGDLLGHWLVEHAAHGFHEYADFIAPIPSSPDRYSQRGFGIAEEIAKGVSSALCLPVVSSALAIVRPTRDLRQLGVRERARELAGAFEVKRTDLVQGSFVLVIDDVTTHGTTLREAGRALRQAGATRVNAAVLAHTESSWWR